VLVVMRCARKDSPWCRSQVRDDKATQRTMPGSMGGFCEASIHDEARRSCHARSPTIAPLTVAGAVGIRIGGGR
jgi:hypothetical protein